MEERLDRLSCDGVRPFEEDVYLVGPEGRLYGGRVSTVGVAAVRRFRAGRAMSVVVGLGCTVADRAPCREGLLYPLVCRQEVSGQCQQPDHGKHDRRTLPFLRIECHYSISNDDIAQLASGFAVTGTQTSTTVSAHADANVEGDAQAREP